MTAVAITAKAARKGVCSPTSPLGYRLTSINESSQRQQRSVTSHYQEGPDVAAGTRFLLSSDRGVAPSGVVDGSGALAASKDRTDTEKNRTAEI